MNTYTCKPVRKTLALLFAAVFLAVTQSYAITSGAKTNVAAKISFTGAGAVTYSFDYKSIDSLTTTTGEIAWKSGSVTPGESSWVTADTYVEMVSKITDASGGIQIYTDNEQEIQAPTAPPAKYTGSRTGAAGLYNTDTGKTAAAPLPMAWAIMDTAKHGSLGNLAELVEGTPTGFSCPIITTPTVKPDLSKVVCDYPLFHHFLDAKTAADPKNPCTGNFANGSDPVMVKSADGGIHHAEGPVNYSVTDSPDYLYFAANFNNAKIPANYFANIIIERFTE